MKEVASITDKLVHWAQVAPNSPAFSFIHDDVNKPETLTYQNLYMESEALSSFLLRENLRGQIVILIFQTGLNFIKTFYGCLLGGVIPLSIQPPNFRRSTQFLENVIRDSGASVILTDDSCYRSLELIKGNKTLENMKWISVDSVDFESNSALKCHGSSKNDIALIQYTSGSTTSPKGVVITHNNIIENQKMITQAFMHDTTSTMACWLPHFHDMGLVGNILHPVYVGLHCIAMSPITFVKDPKKWLQIITSYKVNTSGGPNFSYEHCVRNISEGEKAELDLSSWAVAYNGAEPVRHETIEKFASYFSDCGFSKDSFYPCYGMAETTLFISGRNQQRPKNALILVDGDELSKGKVVECEENSEAAKTLVSCGTKWLAEDIKIVDPETKKECLATQIGEIWVSGPHVSKGYWNNSDETDQCAFNAFIENKSLNGPYFRTGDLGFVTAGAEQLYVTGRLKDVIIVRGRNYYPHDIEYVVESSSEEVQPGTSTAFAVTKESEEKLVVVAELKRAFVKNFNMDSIANRVCQNLSTIIGLELEEILLLAPGKVLITSSGKVQRKATKKLYFADGLDYVGKWTLEKNVVKGESKHKHIHLFSKETLNSKFFWPLVNILQEKFGIDLEDIDVSKSIFVYGIDSVNILELIVELEKIVGIHVPIDVFFASNSMRDLMEDIRAFVSNEKVEGDKNLVDDLQEQISWLNNMVKKERLIHNLLLTGATGFLGGFLLKDLLSSECNHVYCLVRAKNLEDGWRRLSDNIEHYQIGKVDRSRITIVLGDVSKKYLGISKDTYFDLVNKIDSVVHCAAIDNFYLPYSVISDVNVVGTKEIIEFSYASKIKPIHYISSCAVSLFEGEKITNISHGLVNGYAKSKFVAEKLILELISKGYPAINYRLGYLYSSGSELVEEVDAFENVLSIMLHMGVVPDMNVKFDLTPVEYASKCISRDINKRNLINNMRTYYNPEPLEWKDVITAFVDLDRNINVVRLDEYNRLFKAYVDGCPDPVFKKLSTVVSPNLEKQLNQMFADVKPDVSEKYISMCPPCDYEFAAKYLQRVVTYASEAELLDVSENKSGMVS